MTYDLLCVIMSFPGQVTWSMETPGGQAPVWGLCGGKVLLAAGCSMLVAHCLLLTANS